MRAAALGAPLAWSMASAAQTCRFEGASSYGGRLAVAMSGSDVAGGRLVDVRLTLDAQPLPLMHTHYLMQEISLTGAQGLAWVAVNDRYRVDGHVVRQSWDLFVRGADGLDAWRIEGKRAGQFERQHPRFASFWDFATFGRPWLAAFREAAPERRPDLDLHDVAGAVQSPLALAFDGLGRLPATSVSVPVFLPGFKDRKRVDVAIGSGTTRRTAPLRYPDLSETMPSTASAWLSPSGQVLQLAFELHGKVYGAKATIRLVGCGSSMNSRVGGSRVGG